MVQRMVSSSFTIKYNDTKILFLCLLWLIQPVLGMSDTSIEDNGIVFSVRGNNETHSQAWKICEKNSAQLPMYISTEIQSTVVKKLGNHWIAVEREESDAPWRIHQVTVEGPGRWKCDGDGNRAITDGETHWMQVRGSSSHPVVCEGGSEEGATCTNSLNVTVSGTMFRLCSNSTPFAEARDICTGETARLPHYLSTEIQSKVVKALGNHWIGLRKKDGRVWVWRGYDLPADISNKLNAAGDGDRAITDGGSHWKNVRANSLHQVVCEGGSGYGNTTVIPIPKCTVPATQNTPVSHVAVTAEATPRTTVTTTTAATTDNTTTTTISETTTISATGTTTTDTDTTSNDTDATSTATDATSKATDTTSTDTDTTSKATDTTRRATDTTSTDTDTTSKATDTTSTEPDTTSTEPDTTSTTTDTTSTDTDSVSAETTVEPQGVDRMGRKIFKKCTCRCRNPKATPSEPEAVAEKVTELKKNVSVNTRDTTNSIVKKTSRVDKRSSPGVIGWVYLIVVAIPFMAVIFGDVLKVVKWFCVQNKVKPISSVTDSPWSSRN